MMTCRELVQFLSDYLGDDLPVEQRLAFERHICCCPPCKQYVETYRLTMDLTRDLCGADDQAPCDMPESLVAAILKAKAADKTPKSDASA